MTIAITGGAGFIGSNLARYINRVSPETEIRIIDNLVTGFKENLDGVDCQFTEKSILDDAALRETIRGAGSVVHLAALGSVPRSIAAPRPTHETNATGTLNVLEACRAENVGHIVVASSSSVYGNNPSLPKTELDWTRPMSPYSVTKLATEAYALAYHFSFGIDALAFRFFNVFGPAQSADHVYAAVIPKFLDAALNGRNVVIHGDGRQSRDFTYVLTVCQAIWSAVRDRTSATNPVNLAYGASLNLLDVVARIERQLDRRIEIEFAEPRIGDVRASQADGMRIRELFPELQPTDFDTGLSETIHWFQQRQDPH